MPKLDFNRLFLKSNRLHKHIRVFMFSYNPSLKDTRHKLLFSSIIVFIYLINICMPITFKVLSRKKKEPMSTINSLNNHLFNSYQAPF